MFVLERTFTQQIFTGSYHGQGPGLADLVDAEGRSSFSSLNMVALDRLMAMKSQCHGESVLLE